MTWAEIVCLVGGFVTLVAGAEVLIRGASRLAAALGISPLVIGLTVVAYGTSAPELAINLVAVHTDRADIAMGNVVGSNIFNVLFILGLCGMIGSLRVDAQLIRVDVPIMIGVSLVVLMMALDGRIGRLDGAALTAGIVAYTVFSIRQSRRASRRLKEEYAHEYGPELGSGGGRTMSHAALVLGGLVLLVAGSRWLIEGATAAARAMGVSELVIGLTVVAAGTSMPEVATSVIAAIRGERDLAVGNIVGSNLFNLMSVLGFASLFAPDGITVCRQALIFDLPVMVAVAVACLPIFFTGHCIARWEGALFLAYYLFYTFELFVLARSWEEGQRLVWGISAFVVPLTLVTLGISVYRTLHSTGRRIAP
jgi:cation:H+ antiporter